MNSSPVREPLDERESSVELSSAESTGIQQLSPNSLRDLRARHFEIGSNCRLLVNLTTRQLIDANRLAITALMLPDFEQNSISLDELFPRSRDLLGDKKLSALLRNGFLPPAYELLCRGDGSCVYVRTEWTRLDDSPGYASLQLRIESPKEAEDRNRIRNEPLFQSSGDAVLWVDPVETRIVEANPAACKLFHCSIEELKKIPSNELLSEQDVDSSPYWRIQLKCSDFLPNIKLKRNDGTSFWGEIRSTSVEVDGIPRYLVVIRDVTWRVEREQELEDSYRQLENTQARLVQTSKLSAMGELGASVAHELAQPLTILSGIIERIKRNTERNVGDYSEDLAIVSDELNRMMSLVGSIRSFSRQKSAPLKRTDLREICKHCAALMAGQLRQLGIKFNLVLPASASYAKVDSARIHQVLINLISNSRDAIEELQPTDPQIDLILNSNDYGINLIVSDNGSGIPQHLVNSVLQPFFTTKDTEKGTGLGLSISRDIIQDHGGTLSIGTSASGGAELIINLPHASD